MTWHGGPMLALTLSLAGVGTRAAAHPYETFIQVQREEDLEEVNRALVP